MNMKDAEFLLKSNRSNDVKNGIDIVTKLSARGDPLASYAKASWHINNVYGFEKDYDEITKLLMVAMNGLIPDAFYDYAVLVRSSKRKGALKDAFAYLVVSACAGDVEAKKAVANAMFNGEGCFKNIDAASYLDKILDKLHNHKK